MPVNYKLAKSTQVVVVAPHTAADQTQKGGPCMIGPGNACGEPCQRNTSEKRYVIMTAVTLQTRVKQDGYLYSLISGKQTLMASYMCNTW